MFIEQKRTRKEKDENGDGRENGRMGENTRTKKQERVCARAEREGGLYGERVRRGKRGLRLIGKREARQGEGREDRVRVEKARCTPKRVLEQDKRVLEQRRNTGSFLGW
jgi:hypothetical protein